MAIANLTQHAALRALRAHATLGRPKTADRRALAAPADDDRRAEDQRASTSAAAGLLDALRRQVEKNGL